MLKKLLMVVVMSTAAVSAFAGNAARADVQKTIELKNGSTIFIFNDGKMAMEDKLGRAASMKKGVVMEAKDGQKIMMHGNEVMRLESLITKESKGS
jgi:hypothetical protein